MLALVAEDDDDIADAIATILSSVGFESRRATNGRLAVDLAADERFDLIVLDLVMPGGNGYIACREIRAMNIGTPILVLTSKSGTFDEIEALETGADDFIRKPFEPSVLAARAMAMTRRGDRPHPRLQRIGDYDFDVTTHCCRRDGELIELTRRESEVLSAIAAAGNRAASRERLLRDVWGADFDGDPNVVDVYIGYLRKKLGRSVIRTRRGLGFSVAAAS